MKFENGFEVDAPIDEVWTTILDVEKVAPCMPGAELTEVVDDTTWKGKVAVKGKEVAAKQAVKAEKASGAAEKGEREVGHEHIRVSSMRHIVS